MKLIYTLSVDNTQYQVMNIDIRLETNTPGRAVFTVESERLLSGIVIFDVGYTVQNSQRYFIGFVDKSTTIDHKQQLLFCRELASVLSNDIPLSLRHVTLKQVLSAITEQTQIVFSVVEADYTDKKIPYFYSVSNGIHCLDNLGAIFNIDDYIWQQQGDGEVFVGDWNDSYWRDRPVSIPDNIITEHSQNNSARIPAIPQLRPGIVFNDNHRISHVQLKNDKMVIKW